MSQQFQIALRTSLIICLGFPFLGLFIKNISVYTAKFFSRKGTKFYVILHNYLTIPGVFHHELSHAALAFLTGAKIGHIHLFKPDENEGSLGSVSFAPRGPVPIQAIQMFLTSIAPVPCGIATCWIIQHFILVKPDLNIVQNITFRYLIICILIHANMSVQDIITMAKGFPLVFIMIFLISYFTKFDILVYLMEFI